MNLGMIRVREKYIPTRNKNKMTKAIADLNPLFIDQINNFSHLLTIEIQTKEEFLQKIKTVYSLDNIKTSLFYEAVKRSTFENIALSENRTSVLFNI